MTFFYSKGGSRRQKPTLPYADLIKLHRAKILQGTVLAVDPSVGSNSSMPGWAIYKGAKLVESGTIDVSTSLPLSARLFAICSLLREQFPTPDIFVIEYITKFGPRKIDSLLKGVGAIMAGVSAPVCIEVPPHIWKKSVDLHYVKSDEADAIYIGRYVILEAARAVAPFKKKALPGVVKL